MKSEFAEGFLSNLTYSRPKMTLEEKLAGACPEAIDLCKKLLAFNPEGRPTAEECLAHPYLAQFHRPKREIIATNKIVMALPDSQKFSRRDYRNQIYKEAITAPDMRGKRRNVKDKEKEAAGD
jgi:mitogen-activated protein kinase 15